MCRDQGCLLFVVFSAWRPKCHPPIGNNRQMEPKPRLIVHLTTVFFSFFLCLLQVLVGNTDENTIVYNEFNGSIVARYTRFQPTAWHNHISMRVELYGCKGTFLVTSFFCGIRKKYKQFISFGLPFLLYC